MKLIRKLFAEKILRFYEGTDSGVRFVSRLPIIKNYIDGNSFGEKSKVRVAIGVTVQVLLVLWEFIKKFFYVAIFMHIPYVILSRYNPLIKLHEELFMIFVFVIISTICGSLANTTIFAMGDRDYLMIRVMLVSPYMNFLGKLIYKMFSDFIYYFIILMIYQVKPLTALMLSLLTMFSRPIGEMITIISYDYFHGIYENRNVFNGTIMAISVLFAYGYPIINKSISGSWINAIHPVVIIIMFLLGGLAMAYLWWYKYYRRIVGAAMHKKRED